MTTITFETKLDYLPIPEGFESSTFPTYSWLCTFTVRGETLEIPFFEHQGNEPTFADVLGCVVSDASCVYGNDFDEFCSELGLDNDSRSAERTYNACKAQTEAFEQLVGTANLQHLMYEIDRDEIEALEGDEIEVLDAMDAADAHIDAAMESALMGEG